MLFVYDDITNVTTCAPQTRFIAKPLKAHNHKTIPAVLGYYRQVSNIRRTKPQHLKDSRTVLWLSLPNPLKPYVKSRMKM